MRSPRSREVALRADDDVLSTVSTNSSTVATTASLASRIAGLTLDLEDATAKEQELGTFPEEEEEEVETAQEGTLRSLDAQEDPFQVCSRLFRRRVSNPVPVKRVNIRQMEEFKQHGYLILDNFVTREAMVAIREMAVSFKERGYLVDAAKLGNPRFQDATARGDYTAFLHIGRPPMDTPAFSSLTVALQELQSDLHEFMELQEVTEYQLTHYPPNNSMYKKHRDALPDDGREPQQRRVTAIVYINPEWKMEDGGELRIWPPRRNQRANDAAHLRLRSMDPQNGSVNDVSTGGPYSQRLHQPPALSRFLGPSSFGERRSNGWHEYPRTEPSTVQGVSEADNSISEPSECVSPRSDLLDHTGLGNIPKSTTSSAMADLGLLDGLGDVGSIDDASVVSSYYHEQTRNGVDWVEVGEEMVLDVAPLGGRCVLFLSGAVDHAVMPTHFDCYAITSWFK